MRSIAFNHTVELVTTKRCGRSRATQTTKNADNETFVCYSESERKEKAKKRLEKRLEKRENT